MPGLPVVASVHYVGREGHPSYCLLTYEHGSDTTEALTPAVALPVRAGRAKLTMMTVDAGNTRIVHTGTAFLEITEAKNTSQPLDLWGCAFVFEGCAAANFTASVLGRASAAVVKAERAYQGFVARAGLEYTHPLAPQYVHRRMMDGEFPPGVYMPSVEGYSQMDSLSNLGDYATRHAWSQCVAVAKLVTGFDASRVTNAALAQECLFVCALRVIAGHYPPRPEDADDRCIRHMRLYTNTDCDDMMVTCGALFRRMQRVSWSSRAGPFEPEGLGQLCVKQLEDVECCMGLVDMAVGNPNKSGEELIGHVWGCIRKKDGTRLHVESTRTTQCHSGSPDTLYGPGVFCTAPGTKQCESSLQVLDVARYRLVCSLYTVSSTAVVCTKSSIGCAYGVLLRGGARVMQIPTTGSMDAELDAYRHRPCAGCILVVQKDVPECKSVCLHGFVGLDAPCPLLCPEGEGLGRPAPGSTALIEVMPSLYWAFNKLTTHI